MGMICSFGFNDTALRFKKAEHPMRCQNMELVGEMVIGGDGAFLANDDLVCVSDSILFDDTKLLSMVSGCIESFASVDGVLGFIHYDKKSGDMLAVGDYLGRVPLYYYHQKNLFGHKLLIASELKCFFGLPLKDVKLLGMGGYITLRGGVFSVGSYTTIDRELQGDAEDETVLASIRNLLTSAVQKIVKGTNRLCVFLSGGVDSTVCAALAKKFKPDITAYTFSVGDKGKADLHYARLAAKELDIPLTEVVVTQDDVMSALREIVYFNEDFNWTQITSAVGQYFLAKAAAKDGFLVALCGDLADEIFASYPQIARWSWRDEQYVDARTKLINKAWINPNRSVKVMGNAGGVSYVDPYSDREFLEFASNVHPRFKDGKLQGKRVNKWLLRSAFADVIPTEIATRPKGCQGTVSFVDEIFNSPEGKKLIKDTYDSMFNHEGRIVNVVK